MSAVEGWPGRSSEFQAPKTGFGKELGPKRAAYAGRGQSSSTTALFVLLT